MANLSSRFYTLSLFAGVALLLLLPVGIFTPVSGLLFVSVFLLHLVLHVASLIKAVQYLAACFSESSSRILGIILCVVCIAVVVPHSFLPPTARDALIHHLAVPKWWVAADRIVEISWHEWSYYPMLLQLAYTGFLSLKLSSLIAFYHFTYALLAAAVVAHIFSRESENRECRVAVISIFLSLPMVLRLGSTQLVDLGLVFYSTLAVSLTFLWQEKRSFLHLVGIGASLGFALGCKYNGLLFAGVYFLCLPLYLSRSQVSFKQMIWAVTVIGLTTLVVYCPWFLKNLFTTGNPLYPLFGGFFGTAVPTPGVSGLKSFELRSLKYGEGIVEYLLLPIRMLIYGSDHDPQYFDGRLSPVLLLLLLCFRSVRKSPRILFLLLLTVVYSYLALFYSGARVRYMLPILGIVACLSVYGLSLLMERRRARLLVNVVCAFQMIWLALYLPSLLERTNVVAYYTQDQSRDEYLLRQVSEYSLARALRNSGEAADAESTYLLYTGNRFYYYDVPVRSAGHFGANEVIRWLHTSPDVEALSKYFHMNNIGRIAAHVERLRGSLQNALPAREAQLWNEFQQTRLRLSNTVGPYGIWEIVQ